MTDDGVGDGQPKPPLVPRLIEANPTKFSGYVLDPAKAAGKDVIFVGRLGYREGDPEDARTLVATYVAQARTALAEGDYVAGGEDVHGRRYLVPIELGAYRLRSAWVLRPNGVFSLVTPFSGFWRRSSPGGKPSQ